MMQQISRGDAMQFSSKNVVDTLRRAGWQHARHVAVGEVINSLQSVGFDVPTAAVRFLSEFAFLELEHEPSISLHGDRSSCWTRFDPTAVSTSRDARISKRCAAIARKGLCPVGTDGFHLTIYIAHDSTFFAGRDSSVFHYAESVDGLMAAMYEGVRPSEIGQWSME
jgi:hypothetical protein